MTQSSRPPSSGLRSVLEVGRRPPWGPRSEPGRPGKRPGLARAPQWSPGRPQTYWPAPGVAVPLDWVAAPARARF